MRTHFDLKQTLPRVNIEMPELIYIKNITHIYNMIYILKII